MVLVATQVKRRRGTTAENDAFTGAEGEIVVDTERHELRVHDGVTQGGFRIGGGSSLVIGQILEVTGTADYTPEGCLLADGAEYTKAQFPDLWADFLTGTPKLQTCTYTEYANQIAEYGFCNKFAVDTTNETFKVPTRNKYRKLVKKIVNGTTWANLYDDGWVEQGGIASAGTSNVSFLIEMANTNYCLTSTWRGNNTLHTISHSFSTTGCNLLEGQYATSGRTLTAPANWQVCGYASTIPDSTANITREFVVVANGTLNQEQMDWSAWASSLAGRAKTDMDNITSTGKETVIGWGMPDYTAGITISTAGGGTYTAPQNGFIKFTLGYSGSNAVSINNTNSSGVGILYIWTQNNQGSTAYLPVAKNQIIYLKERTGTVQIIFYPAKGGNNA